MIAHECSFETGFNIKSSLQGSASFSALFEQCGVQIHCGQLLDRRERRASLKQNENKRELLRVCLYKDMSTHTVMS